MQYWLDLALFAGKTFFIVFGFIAILSTIFYLVSRGRSRARTELEVEKLNDHFKQLQRILQAEVLDKKELKAIYKTEKKELKKKPPSTDERRAFVLDFDGDIRASAVEDLREEVTTLLTVAKVGDEVVVRLESPGGMVSPYGLAASQLKRLRDAGIKLTVCVDTVAASGGYMMACVGEQILAAPFAIVGSIGVVAGLPNFHRLLSKHDIEYREVTAGEFKRTVSMFGEITPGGFEKFKTQIEDVHILFKSFVRENRPQLDIQGVATGEYWYGTQALELKLIDKIQTSDDYLFGLSKHTTIYKLHHHHRVPMSERLTQRFAQAAEQALEKVLTLAARGRFGI